MRNYQLTKYMNVGENGQGKRGSVTRFNELFKAGKVVQQVKPFQCVPDNLGRRREPTGPLTSTGLLCYVYTTQTNNKHTMAIKFLK